MFSPWDLIGNAERRGEWKWSCYAVDPCCLWLPLLNHSVVSDSLWPYGLQQARLPCSSLAPQVCSNSCSLSRWCHPTISSSVVPFPSCPQSFPSIRVFSNESVLRIKWKNNWSFSFSISPSNEYSGLISFRNNWFDPLAVPLISKGLSRVFFSPAPQFKHIHSLMPSLLYGTTLTSLHDYLKNHSFDDTDLCLHPAWHFSWCTLHIS